MSEQYLMMTDGKPVGEKSDDVKVEVDRASRRIDAMAKQPAGNRSQGMESMSMEMGPKPSQDGEQGIRRCVNNLCSVACFSRMSCLSVTVMCIVLIIILTAVATALAAMNNTKIISSQVYPSTEFVSLVKSVVQTNGIKTDTWLMVVPESILNKPFVVSDAITKGDGKAFIAGMPGLAYSGIPFYFALDTDRTALSIYIKQTRFRASSAEDKHLLDVAADDKFIRAIPVVADIPGTSITVPVSAWLKSHADIPVSEWSGRVDVPVFSRVVSANCFPRNCLLDIEIVTTSGETMTSSLSVSLLPQQTMTPRHADKRIGYFTTEFTDIGLHSASDTGARASEVNKKYQYIHKWKLEKSENCDDGGNLCEPKKPIIYHIDPTIPKKWRKYMKKAVELWQPSFAELGFKNTPRARLPEDDDWPNDYHSGDIRYSSIRMGLMEDGATAIGPVTVDPRSGEVLDADISFPLNWLSVFTGGWADMTTLGLTGNGLANVPETIKANKKNLRSRLAPLHGHHGCAHEHFRQSAASIALQMRSLAAERDDGRVPLEIIGDGLIEVAVHEVGHTLGLRHNFKGSSIIPYDAIYKGEYTEKHGKSSSVMDYTSAVIAPTKALQDGAIVFPAARTVGAYDRLAIEYGYKIFSGEAWNVKPPGVTDIANQMAAKGLEFATDEDSPGALNSDQLSQRYDLTDDPVSWVNDRFKVSDRMVKNARTAVNWDGSENGYEAQGNYVIMALMQSSREIAILSNLLGGVTLNKQYPSAPPPIMSPTKKVGEPLVSVISSAYQRYNLKVMVSFVTDYRSWLTESDQLLRSGTAFYSTASTPTRQVFDYICEVIFKSVMSVTKMAQVAKRSWMESQSAETWSPKSWTPPAGSTNNEPLSPYEVLRVFSKAVFGFDQGTEAFWKSPVEWSLQTKFVDGLVRLYKGSSTDANFVQVAVDASRAIRDLHNDITLIMTEEVLSMDERTKLYLNQTSLKLSDAIKEK